jgi:hypothetical protein
MHSNPDTPSTKKAYLHVSKRAISSKGEVIAIVSSSK